MTEIKGCLISFTSLIDPSCQNAVMVSHNHSCCRVINMVDTLVLHSHDTQSVVCVCVLCFMHVHLYISLQGFCPQAKTSIGFINLSIDNVNNSRPFQLAMC